MPTAKVSKTFYALKLFVYLCLFYPLRYTNRYSYMAQSTPTVSVILPNYNYASLLPERINSILTQSFADFELIILDDASPDNSLEVIERYRTHPKVGAVVVNPTNSGSPFLQWQKGLELARGKYVWIAEADDSASSEFLATCVDLLERYPDAVVAFTGSHCIDPSGAIMQEDFDGWRSHPAKCRGGYGVFDSEEYLRRNLYWRNYVYNASGTLFRRDAVNMSVFHTVGAMRNCGDWYFWADLISRGRVIEVYEKLNRLRRHPSSVTQQGNRSGRVLREEMEVMLFIESLVAISPYRRMLRRGELLKQIRRSKDLTPSLRADLLAAARATVGATPLHTALERLNKALSPLLPLLVTSRRDRL